MSSEKTWPIAIGTVTAAVAVVTLFLSIAGYIYASGIDRGKISRELGILSAKMENLNNKFDVMNKRMDKIDKDLRILFINQARFNVKRKSIDYSQKNIEDE